MSKRSKSIKIPNILTESHLQKDIESYVEVNIGASTKVKGDLFTEWVLKFVFERQDEDIEFDASLSGSGDNSIDAWFDDGINLCIVQTKYNTSHSREGFTSFYSDLTRLLENPYNTIGNKQDFEEFSETLQNYLDLCKRGSEGNKIFLYYITNALLTDDFQSKFIIDKQRLEERFPFVTINAYGLKEVYEHILMSLDELPIAYTQVPKKLLLKNYFLTGDTCVAEVQLKHFAKFIQDNQQYIFFSNIRNYLGNTPINKDIQETFSEKPTDFWYYNNGITIICDDFDEKYLKNSMAGELKIKAPQIVNGCQTSNAIYEGFKLLHPEEKNTKEGCILIKIIKDKNKNRVHDIIQFTNTQNSVSAMDYFALERFHRNLSVQFIGLGYNYEIQRKAKRFKNKKDKHKYGSNNENKKFSYLFPSNFNFILPVKQVITAYTSGMYYMPGTAGSRAGDLAPGGKANKIIFNDNTPNDPLYFLFPFAVMNYARYILGYGATNRGKKNKANTPSDNRRRNQTEYKRNCLMLFVAIYFRLIVRLFKHVGAYNQHDSDNPLLINIDVYSLIFENKKLNIELFEATDRIIYDYLNDNVVKGLIQENLPKFLKTDIEKNEIAINLVIQKIDNVIEAVISNETYNRIVEISKNINKFEQPII
jgi:hypothetical protein